MKRGMTPLMAIRAMRERFPQLDTLAQLEARVRSRERVESVWRQATDRPRKKEVCHA